jgi:hypothetical protein
MRSFKTKKEAEDFVQEERKTDEVLGDDEV